MGAAFFYHLTRAPLEATLPILLGKSLGAGWKVAVRGPNRDRMEWLDQKLWLGPEDAFLPHGLSGGPHDAQQPVLLTTVGQAAANDPACLMAIDVAWLAHHGEARLSSVFLNPNLLSAMFNLIALPATAGFLYAKQYRRSMTWLAIAIFILVYAIGLIQSRGAILCLLAALLILIFVCRSLISRKRVLFLGVIVAAALLIPTVEIHQSIASPSVPSSVVSALIRAGWPSGRRPGNS